MLQMNKTTQATRNKRYRDLLCAATVTEPLTIAVSAGSNNRISKPSSKAPSGGYPLLGHKEPLADQGIAYLTRNSRRPLQGTSHTHLQIAPPLAVRAGNSSQLGAEARPPKPRHHPLPRPAYQDTMPMINDIEALLDKFRQDDKSGQAAKQPSSGRGRSDRHDAPISGTGFKVVSAFFALSEVPRYRL